jgi:hypothetical protein
MRLRMSRSVRTAGTASSACPLSFAGLGGEVLDAADASFGLVPSEVNRVAAPAEATLRLTGATLAQSTNDFGHERATFMAFEAMSSRVDQVVEGFGDGVHGA